MLFVIIFFLLIVFTLSYFIWWLIYRKAFKSKKKISKILVFIGGIGLITFYYTPYSYYLEPSFWEFKNICKLDPEIYQFNGGKIDEEYYNKVLKYFDTSLDTLDWESIEKNSTLLTPEYLDYDENNEKYLYSYKIQKSRIKYIAHLLFEHKIDKRHLMKIEFALIWDTKRKYLTTKGMSSYELVFKPYRETCNIFEKGD